MSTKQYKSEYKSEYKSFTEEYNKRENWVFLLPIFYIGSHITFPY